MSGKSMNIVIGGAAGQGLATIGTLMSKAMTRAGFHMLVNQKYMSRVRGGHNTFAIRFGNEPVLGATEDIDILLALNAESVELHKDELTNDSIVICGDDIDAGTLPGLRIPFNDLAPKPLFFNTVGLGVLAASVCLDITLFETLLAET